MILTPPHLVGEVDRELQLGPLLFLGEDIALFGRGKAALRRERKLIERRLRGTRLPRMKTLEDLDFSRNPEV